MLKVKVMTQWPFLGAKGKAIILEQQHW